MAATFGAPVIEETLKGLVLIGLLWRRRGEIDGPTDGVIYAAMVGLGFAMIENVGYYINALVSPERGGIALLGYTFVLRGVVSPLLHPIFTSMTGLGVAYAASRRSGGKWAVALGLLAAMIAARHMERPVAVRHGGPGRRVPDHVGRARRADRRPGRRPPPGHRPHPPLPARLPAHRPGHRRRRGDARLAAGPRRRPPLGPRLRRPPAATAMSDYQLAATELALACAKADRGVLDFNAFAAREHSLLTLMAVARSAFNRHVAGGSEITPAPWAASASALTHGDHFSSTGHAAPRSPPASSRTWAGFASSPGGKRADVTASGGALS